MGMSLRILGWVVGIGAVLFLVGKSTGNYLWLALYLVLVAIAYVISLRTHPERPCWYCGGSGRHMGWLWSYARRPCSHCDGDGWVERWGSGFFNG